MTLRRLTNMVRGRQTDEWARTGALLGRIGNLMGKFSVEPYLPEHLKRKPQRSEREQNPAEVAMNWKLLRGAFKSGKIKQG